MGRPRFFVPDPDILVGLIQAVSFKFPSFLSLQSPSTNDLPGFRHGWEQPVSLASKQRYPLYERWYALDVWMCADLCVPHALSLLPTLVRPPGPREREWFSLRTKRGQGEGETLRTRTLRTRSLFFAVSLEADGCHEAQESWPGV